MSLNTVDQAERTYESNMVALSLLLSERLVLTGSTQLYASRSWKESVGVGGTTRSCVSLAKVCLSTNGVDQVVQSRSRLFMESTKEELMVSAAAPEEEDGGDIPAEGSGGKARSRSRD